MGLLRVLRTVALTGSVCCVAGMCQHVYSSGDEGSVASVTASSVLCLLLFKGHFCLSYNSEGI